LILPTKCFQLHAIFLKRFDLRAADGLQLAAAIAWRGFDDERTVFITGDNRLGDAAKASGFYVKSTAK